MVQGIVSADINHNGEDVFSMSLSECWLFDEVQVKEIRNHCAPFKASMTPCVALIIPGIVVSANMARAT